MGIPTVEKCCCGCSLRLGSGIIGVLFFLSNLGQMIASSVQASNANEINEYDKTTYIISAVMSGIMLLATIILLIGVHKEKQGLLKPWIWLYTVLATIVVVIFIVAAVICFVDGEAALGAGFLVTAIIYILIIGYCIVVVNSYYLSLLNGGIRGVV